MEVIATYRYMLPSDLPNPKIMEFSVSAHKETDSFKTLKEHFDKDVVAQSGAVLLEIVLEARRY